MSLQHPGSDPYFEVSRQQYCGSEVFIFVHWTMPDPLLVSVSSDLDQHCVSQAFNYETITIHAISRTIPRVPA